MGREMGGGEVVGMGIAIVTGASSGMGVSYVRALAQEAGVEEIWACIMPLLYFVCVLEVHRT